MLWQRKKLHHEHQVTVSMQSNRELVGSHDVVVNGNTAKML